MSYGIIRKILNVLSLIWAHTRNSCEWPICFGDLLSWATDSIYCLQVLSFSTLPSHHSLYPYIKYLDEAMHNTSRQSLGLLKENSEDAADMTIFCRDV